MLDAWIIDWIKKNQPQPQEQPQLPIPEPEPKPKEQKKSDRGVIVIDL